jgi:RND family efflux transporter MFP subunit
MSPLLQRRPGSAAALPAFLLLSSLSLPACGRLKDAAAPADATAAAGSTGEQALGAANVRTSPAVRGEVLRTLELGGVAEAWEQARLAPTVPGRISRIAVELGQAVQKGDLLAEMDTSTLRLQLEQARRALELARLQGQDARNEAERARTLVASGAITAQQAEKAELGVALAEAQLAQGEAQLAVLDEQVRQGTLLAPFDGTVTGVFAREGEFFSTMASLSGPPALVSLAALDAIRLDLQVPDRDIVRFAPGVAVELSSDALPGWTGAGEVTHVAAAAEPGTRVFRVRVRIPNTDGQLRPGLFLRGKALVERRDGVVAIPPDAVIEGGNGGESAVMLVSEQRARRVPVKVGLRGDHAWEVEGVEPGAELVVEGQFGLPDGAAVKVLK